MNDQLSDTTVDQGTQNVDGSDLGWRSALPDNLKNHEFVKDYAKPGDAIQDFVNLKTEAATMLKVPGDDATDEDRSAFYGKLGRPETAEEYTIAKPENLPDGVEYDENVETVFKGVFHEIGLSDQNANALWGKYHEMVTQGHEMEQKAEKEALDTAINSLKDEWTGDKFKVNTEVAHRAFSGVFEDAEKQSEAKTFIEETKINGLPLGSHPMFLKVFQKIGSIIGDDKINQGRDDSINAVSSDEERARKRFPNIDF